MKKPLYNSDPKLEINYGDAREPKIIKLTHVGDNTFMIKKRFAYCDLYHDIDKWSGENANMTKQMYTNFVALRSGQVAVQKDIFKEDNSLANLIEAMDKSYSEINHIECHGDEISEMALGVFNINDTENGSDSEGFNTSEIDIELEMLLDMKPTLNNNRLFVCDVRGNQKELNIREKKLTYDHGEIDENGISTMCITPDRLKLFIGCISGDLYEFSIEKQRIVKKYEKIHERINSLKITNDGKYFFTYDYENGCLKQSDLKEQKCIKTYEFKKRNNYNNGTITCTHDNKYCFINNTYNNLVQISIDEQKKLKTYKNIIQHTVCSIVSTPDSQSLFIGCMKGHLYQFDITAKKISKFYDQIHGNSILSMAITPDNEFQFTSSASGDLKQISIRKQLVVKDYNKIHISIHSICMTTDDEYLFTSDDRGNVKQFSISEKVQVKDYGRIMDNRICSITC